MKPLVALMVTLAGLAMVTGCRSLFVTPAPSSSVPVQSGAATTNDPVLIAWEKYAQAVNRQAPANPLQPVIETVLGAIIAVSGAVAAVYAHGKGVKAGHDVSKVASSAAEKPKGV